MTPEMFRRTLDAQARLQSDGFYRLLSGESVVVVVGNYKCYSWIYEVRCSSACTSGFDTHVECRVAPCVGRYLRPLRAYFGSPTIITLAGLEDALLFALPVALFGVGSFVMKFLALGQPDLEFGATTLPVQRQGYQGVTFALGQSDQFG